MPDLEIPDGFGAAPTAGAPIPQGFAPAPPYTSQLFPVSVDAGGNYSPAVPGLLQRAWSAATAPGDVFTGRAATPYSAPAAPVAPGMMSSQPSPDVLNRANDFASFFSPASAAMRAGEMVPGEFATTQAPTAQQLKGAASAGYDAARASGATVPGDAVAAMSQQLQQTLQGDHGVIAKTAPKTFAILDELANPPAGGMGTYSGLEAARRGLSTIAGEGGTEGFAAQKAIAELNPFIDSVAPQAADARANYAAAMRSNSLTGDLDRANTGILGRAEGRAHASNSGANLDNAIRQRVESLLEKPREVSGFSDAEIAALKAVRDGSLVQNAARRVGNVFGGGGGLGQLAAGFGGSMLGGHVVGGPEGAALGAMIPTALGVSAKAIENSLARRSLNSADEVVRMNSPLARAMDAQGLLSVPAMGRNSAVLRSILPGLLSPPVPQSRPMPRGLLDWMA